MAATLHMVKHLGALRPAQDQDTEVFGHMKIADGEMVKVKISRPRNYRFHCKFFVMLSIIVSNQDHYKCIDDLLDVCKLRIGHVRTVETANGIERFPASISFSSMDDTEFSEFYDRAINWMLAEVIPGLQRQHLDAEVEAELVGFAA